MPISNCPTCAAFLVLESERRTHVCPPAWHVVPDDDPADELEPAREYARDAGAAAEKHLEHNFSRYDWPSGGMGFKVRPAAGGEWVRYFVEVETQPVFTARKVKP